MARKKMCPAELQTPSQIKVHAVMESLSSEALNISVVGQFFKPYKPKTGVLVAMGNHLKIIRWVEEFLKSRTFRMKLGGHLSTEGISKSGVFQDSMLVPLLCLIYINDPLGELTCNRLFFAGHMNVTASQR